MFITLSCIFYNFISFIDLHIYCPTCYSPLTQIWPKQALCRYLLSRSTFQTSLYYLEEKQQQSSFAIKVSTELVLIVRSVCTWLGYFTEERGAQWYYNPKQKRKAYKSLNLIHIVFLIVDICLWTFYVYMSVNNY